MDIQKLRSDLNKIKEQKQGSFVAWINDNTRYTYRHVHNFLTKNDYNVTINFVQDMHNLTQSTKHNTQYTKHNTK